MRLLWKTLGYCAITLIASGAAADAKDSAEQASCRKFVQDFYNWYVPTPKRAKELTCEDAFKLKKVAFDAELLRQLKIDSDAQDKVQGEIVGLDMDPIIASNAEPYDRYVVETIKPKNGNYWAEVFGITGGKKTDKPVVTPEARFKNKAWQFVDFHYGESKFPENESLLKVLKALRESRAKNPVK